MSWSSPSTADVEFHREQNRPEGTTRIYASERFEGIVHRCLRNVLRPEVLFSNTSYGTYIMILYRIIPCYGQAVRHAFVSPL